MEASVFTTTKKFQEALYDVKNGFVATSFKKSDIVTLCGSLGKSIFDDFSSRMQYNISQSASLRIAFKNSGTTQKGFLNLQIYPRLPSYITFVPKHTSP